MQKTRALMWLVAIVVIVGIAGSWWYFNAPSVSAVTATRGPAVHAIYATGNVEATYWAKVTPQVQARIVEICACEGESVKEGDKLARLDDQEARANLAEMKAKEEFYAQELNRYLRLSQSSAASEQAYQLATSNYAQARAATAAATERLNRYVLRAPLDGTVLRQDGEVGEVVSASDVLFWVGKPRPLRIEAEVDEEDIPSVRTGQAALIKSDAFEGKVLSGSVNQITPMGDPVNKNYRVRVSLPDDTPLMIGMTTEINIIVREVPDALLIPTEAIDKGAVWLLKDGVAMKQTIQVGISGSRMTEVTGGLKATDQIIALPPEDLVDGGRVRVDRGS